ncbi:protein starmaker-like isoform X7 [Trachinotus anak]|uniref:protein starmaker-like isoform X7 n=1 Tax=Trachinotus anak TaxID=443729 RepID=UPI0039F21B0E
MKTGMLLSGFLLFLSRLCAASSDEPVYIKAGGTAHLSAGSVTNPIRSITWKHGPDIAMEWFKGNTDAYRHFKDRGSLNGSTGVMTITETIRSDSGTYTSEINGKVTGETRLLVVSPVSKPTLSKRCNEDMTSCVFTCEGSTTDAEPITYKWMSEEPIGTSTNELLITKEDKRPWFSCALHNPVSNETSDQVQNPFSLINDSDRNRIGIIIGVITAICVFLCICAFALYISRRGKQGRMRLEGREVGGAVQAVGYRYNKDPGGVSNDTETSPLMSNGTATPNQEQLVDDQGAGSQDNNQTPDQLQTPAESPDTNITANQDPGCVVSHKSTNETEKSAVSVSSDQETPNKDQLVDDQGAGSQDNNQTPNQPQTPAESPDTNITANQDPGCVVSHKNTNETETSPLSNGETTPNQEQLVDDQGADSHDNNQTPDQPQTPAESPDTNNLTESLTTVAEVHEVTLNQEQVADDQAAGSQDNNQTPDQLQTPAESPDTNITANQDPGCVVSHKSTNETEKSAVSVSSDQETPNKDQLVDDQGAGSQDNNQTPNQPQTPAESPDTNITANQDPGCVVSHKNTNETETSPLSNGETTPNQEQLVDDQGADSHDNNQTPDQPQTPAESPDTNNLTESLTTVAEVHEVTLNQEQVADDQAAGSQDNNQTPDQLQTPAESPDTNITANQDPGCVVSHKSTNETEKSAVSVSSDQETPNKDQLVDDQGAGSQDNNQTPNQPQTPAESPDTNITANQDPGCVVSHKNTNETETSPLSNGETTPNQEQLVDDQGADSHDNNQTPDQPQTPAESPDTNNLTESLTTVAEVHEVTLNQEQVADDQAAGSQDNNQTPDQLQTPAESPDTNITANQDPGCVVSHKNTNETEKSAVSVSSDQETPNKDQLVDDQAAGPEVKDQS